MVEVVGLSEDDLEFLIPPDPADMVVSKLEERRFSKKIYKMQCSEQRLAWLDSLSPSEVVNLVMRKGMVELGESGRLVACPCRDNPAACFVVDDPRNGEDSVFCCGCAVEQKQKRSLSSGLKKETVFETFNLFKRNCGYWPSYLSSHGSRPTGSQKLLHFVLKDCDDVSVSDDAMKLGDFS
jgi:hypothetical protein